ncbi:MAG TPA: hypothetical protein VLZ89_03100 [Anaerolineales bacterium]|nr:hypothetical protein [Anaerolineales bacterium]
MRRIVFSNDKGESERQPPLQISQLDYHDKARRPNACRSDEKFMSTGTEPRNKRFEVLFTAAYIFAHH